MTWQEVKDDEGRVYYYHSETQQTQWERPDELESEEDKLIRESTVWSKFATEEGKVYYYNRETEESVWSCPEDVRQLLLSHGFEVPSEPAEDAQETESNVDQTKTQATDADLGNDVDQMDIDSHTQDDTLLKESLSAPTPGNTLVKLSDLISAADVRYKNEQKYLAIDYSQIDPEDAKKEYMEMLSENSVDSTWSFNRVMDTFISEIRYWKIQDSLERKNLFELYLFKLQEEQFEKIESSREQFKEKFVKMLSKYEQIKFYTTWHTAKSLIQQESLYSMVPNRLRKEFFEGYVNSLRQDHDNKHKETKRQALAELEDYFKSFLKLDISVSWDTIITTLKSDKRFNDNKNMKSLTDLDILTVYESIMNELEQDFNKLIKAERVRNYRTDRIARDNFKELINELKVSHPDKMNAKTQWFQFVGLMKEEPRFLELCGRRGSSPIDFYWDFIDQENQIIKAKKDIVSQILITFNETTVDQDEVKFDDAANTDQFKKFIGIVQEKESIKDYSDIDLQLIYELICQETINKEKAKAQPQSSTATESENGDDESKKRKLEGSIEPLAPKKRLATLGYGSVN